MRQPSQRAIAGRLILASSLALTGCAAQRAMQDPSLYERIGGQQTIAAVVDDAIATLAADTRINRRFRNASLPDLRRQLVELACLRTGGPCVYTGRDMATVHEGLYITVDEFEALVEDFGRSLDRFSPGTRAGRIGRDLAPAEERRHRALR
jgi:hemoglobin